jgi:hypothetical protein
MQYARAALQRIGVTPFSMNVASPTRARAVLGSLKIDAEIADDRS